MHRAFALTCLLALAPLPAAAQLQQEFDGLTGHVYATVNRGSPAPGYQHGMSFYSALYTLTPDPASGQQLGAGTWLIPDNRTFNEPLCPVGTLARDNWPERGPSYRDVYQTLEGGLGTWGSTRFPASGPKFRVNGVPDCYSNQLGAPGFSFHGERLPATKPGLAHLSNRLLLPPDGTTFAGTNVAALFGYGWIALPLIPAYTSPAGVPTGDQSWTLFFHAANFKGPVAFFPPETWSALNAVDRTGASRGHDRREAMAGSVAIEIGSTPMFTATAANGVRYRRIPRMTFPIDSGGNAVLVQDFRFYPKSVAWDRVAAWIASGQVARQFGAGAYEPSIEGSYTGLRLGSAPVELEQGEFSGGAIQLPGGRPAFGLHWGAALEAGVFPEYYRESGGAWRPIARAQVPAETRLTEQQFTAKATNPGPSLDTSAASPWRSATWRAGPFSVRLNDGSMVDYVWYRFADQPAIARLGLAAADLDRLQAFVESLHAQAGVNGLTFDPPSSGALATLDPAQILTPPAGLERGFVPIAIRQRASGTVPTRDFSGMWWNPGESGWGVSLTQHGTTMFAAWYIYDNAGRPTWVVMPGGRWLTANTFTGDLYTTTGPDPRGAFDPAQVVATRTGTGTLAFSSFDRGTLSWQAGAASGSKPIERQLFGPPAANAAATANYADLWWNPAESGWGLSIAQQHQSLFAAWYVYDGIRQPMWYVLPAGSWITPDTWSGALYRTQGAATPFLAGAFDPAGIQATSVGTMALRFTGPDAATVTYTVDGVTGTKSISRQPF